MSKLKLCKNAVKFLLSKLKVGMAGAGACWRTLPHRIGDVALSLRDEPSSGSGQGAVQRAGLTKQSAACRPQRLPSRRNMGQTQAQVEFELVVVRLHVQAQGVKSPVVAALFQVGQLVHHDHF